MGKREKREHWLTTCVQTNVLIALVYYVIYRPVRPPKMAPTPTACGQLIPVSRFIFVCQATVLV